MHMPLVPELDRVSGVRRVLCELEASLGYMTPCLKQNTTARLGMRLSSRELT